jgi:hydroxymethylbilane synthase
LGLAARIRSVFSKAEMIPAAGQGALGIETRTAAAGPLAPDAAAALAQGLATFVHLPTWLATHAERAVSRALGGSCSVPLAAHAVWQNGQMVLDVALGHALDAGQPLLKARHQGPVADTAAAEALGFAAAEDLKAAGGQAYLDACKAA